MRTVVAPSSLADVLGEDWRRPGGSAQALAEAMRALVVDGRLAVRTRVPSERALRAAARREPRHGVARLRPAARGRLPGQRARRGELAHAAGGAGPAPRLALRPAPAWGVDLSIAALPAPEPQLGEAAAARRARARRRAPSHGYAAAGLPELRAAIARRVLRARVSTRRPTRCS